MSLDQLTGLFAAGIATGEWPAGTDPAVQARLFTAGMYGLVTARRERRMLGQAPLPWPETGTAR